MAGKISFRQGVEYPSYQAAIAAARETDGVVGIVFLSRSAITQGGGEGKFRLICKEGEVTRKFTAGQKGSPILRLWRAEKENEATTDEDTKASCEEDEDEASNVEDENGGGERRRRGV